MAFIDDLKTAVRGRICSTFQNYGDIASYGAGLVDSLGFGTEVLPGVTIPGALANAGISLFCDRDPLPADPPPFVGGQCPGVAYQVAVDYDVFRNGVFDEVDSFVLSNITGPVEGVEINVGNGGFSSISILHAGISSTGPFETSTIVSWENARIQNINRQDGQPDDCGDVEPEYPPLPPGDRSGPITVGPNIFDFQFGNPTINIDGSLTAPISIENNDFSLSGSVNFNSGGINFNFGGASNTDNCCIYPPRVDQDPPPPEDGEPDEDGPPTIIGVLVRSSIIGDIKATEIFQDENPNIYAPKLGHVNFLMKIGDIGCWSSDIPVKNINNYIEGPTTIPIVGVKGTPEKNVVWSLTPVFRDIEATPTDE